MDKVFLDKYVPRVWELYLAQAEESMKEGALSKKVKELIGTAISISMHCEPCVKIHLRRAIKAGASAQEISEMIGVAIMLCGGTAEVWARRIVEAEIKNLGRKNALVSSHKSK